MIFYRFVVISLMVGWGLGSSIIIYYAKMTLARISPFKLFKEE